MGEKARSSSRFAILAGIVYELGRYDEAMELADEADAVSAVDDMEPQIWLRGVRAKVLHLAGRANDAAAAARRAEEFLEAKGSLVLLDRVRAFQAEIEAGRAQG